MKINIDRTSVAMGDDIRPHAQTFDLPSETSLAEVVAYILKLNFLATIAGGKATWILIADRPLGVVAQQWTEPRFLVESSKPISSFGMDVHGVSLMFRYWKQHDPDHVFEELAAGREPRR
jgi:hypothetical protein